MMKDAYREDGGGWRRVYRERGNGIIHLHEERVLNPKQSDGYHQEVDSRRNATRERGGGERSRSRTIRRRRIRRAGYSASAGCGVSRGGVTGRISPCVVGKVSAMPTPCAGRGSVGAVIRDVGLGAGMAGAVPDAVRAGEMRRGPERDVGDAVPEEGDVGEHFLGVEEAAVGGFVDELQGGEGVVADADVVEVVEGGVGGALDGVGGEFGGGFVYLGGKVRGLGG